MNAQEFAALLNGREYRKELTQIEEGLADKFGLTVCFGASDDLLEFRGMIDDEIGAWEGVTAGIRLDKMKIVDDECCPECLAKEKIVEVKAVWCPKELGCSWLITTTAKEFAHFDIMEDGELYCRGVVIDLTKEDANG